MLDTISTLKIQITLILGFVLWAIINLFIKRSRFQDIVEETFNKNSTHYTYYNNPFFANDTYPLPSIVNH